MRVLPYRPFLFIGIALSMIVAEIAGVAGGLSGAGLVFNAAWVWLGVAAPLLLGLSFLCDRKRGHWRVAGWWLILGADLSALFVLSSFLGGWWSASGHPLYLSDYRVLLFYMLVASVVWLGVIVAQDVHRLWLLNRVARHVG